jgi:hypothetical protein
MCVTNTLRGRARPVLFHQEKVYRVPSCTALNECTPPCCAAVCSISPSNNDLVQARSKVCPKRRIHVLPPGKTAKHHERQFVVHDYHDHSQDKVLNNRVGYSTSTLFPLKLHAVLEEVVCDGLGHIVSWAPHGRCFTVHMPKEFVEHILPK